MVVSCCAYKCTERTTKGGFLSFHRFPVDKELRKKWVIAIKRENFVPTAYTRICSKHFKLTDYDHNLGRKTLKQGAVPSIFNFSTHERVHVEMPRKSISLEACENKTPCESIDTVMAMDTSDHSNNENLLQCETISNNENISQCSTKNLDKLRYADNIYPSHQANTRTCTRSPVFFEDFEEEDTGNPLRAKKMWRIAKRVIEKQNASIKYLQNKNSRLTNRIKSVNDTLVHLKKSRRISDDLFTLLQV